MAAKIPGGTPATAPTATQSVLSGVNTRPTWASRATLPTTPNVAPLAYVAPPTNAPVNTQVMPNSVNYKYAAPNGMKKGGKVRGCGIAKKGLTNGRQY